MIKVRNVSKRYGRHQALDNISFEVRKGDILGFLGPNGAGKSTTMNIITGYISCDSGDVLIDGNNILEEPKEAKSKIGYLPEIPPLYNEMTVRNYLEFMFRLKKVRLPKDEHISKICGDLSLTDVSERIIGHLSKGYKQRVGLAQAMLGDPPVLILDEPSVGLDPAQIIEMRNLIRQLGENHTVILSSHVLPEIQAVCDKIVMINNGKIAASGNIDQIMGTGRDTTVIRLIIEGREQGIQSALKGIDGIIRVSSLGETERGCYEFRIESKKDVRRAVSRAIAKTDYAVMLMQPAGHSLEDIYLEIISGKQN
ncbi:MAG: ATP-binding cassette domain-containing protein [Clostridia bacterium]|nr:ATP-binding cassette domain-containing protein [Clostridia bacterium]